METHRSYKNIIVFHMYMKRHVKAAMTKTNHIALNTSLRYRPNSCPGLILIAFHFMAWIDKRNHSSTMLYLSSYGSK